MRAISSDKFEAGPLATASATPGPGSGPSGNVSFGHGAESGGDLRPELGRNINAAFARIERGFVRVLHGLRNARDRRQAVRELRRLSPALLADIGIEPEDIERVIDAKFATLGNQPAARKTGQPAPKVRRARDRTRRPGAAWRRLSP